MRNVKSRDRISKNPFSLSKLYRMVESMTIAQKRAFKRDAKFWGEKENGLSYIVLFDIVNRFCAKDEKRESDLLEFVTDNSSAVVRANLSNKANYLYDKILESMRFVSSGSRTFKELNGLMQDIHFLYNKNLLDDCLLKINEARELAIEIDQPTYQIQLNNLEHRISQTISKEKVKYHFNDEGKRNSELLEAIRKRTELISLSDIFRQHSMAKNKMEDVSVCERAQQLIIDYENGIEGLSPRLEYQIITTCISYYRYIYAVGEIGNDVFSNKVGKLQERTIQLMKTFPSFKEDEYPIYQFVMTNYLISLLIKQDLETVKVELVDLEKTEDELFRCRTLAYVTLQSMIQEGRFDDAHDYLIKHKIAKNLLTYNEQIWHSRLLTMWFLGAYICLATEAHKELFSWSQRLTEDINSDQRLDLRYAGFFLNAIAKYELNNNKNTEAFDSLIRISRHLKKRKTTISKAEDQCISTMRKLFRAFWTKIRSKEGDIEMINIGEQWKMECKENSSIQAYFLPLSWLLAKLKGTDIKEEIK